MLNSLDAGRRLALRIARLQLVVAVVIGVAFLALGRREAMSAAAGAGLVALGTVLLSARFFSRLDGASRALRRLWVGLFLKWIVIVGGMFAILVKYKLPPLAAVTGLVAAMAVNLVALRFKG